MNAHRNGRLPADPGGPAGALCGRARRTSRRYAPAPRASSGRSGPRGSRGPWPGGTDAWPPADAVHAAPAEPSTGTPRRRRTLPGRGRRLCAGSGAGAVRRRGAGRVRAGAPPDGAGGGWDRGGGTETGAVHSGGEGTPLPRHRTGSRAAAVLAGPGPRPAAIPRRGPPSWTRAACAGMTSRHAAPAVRGAGSRSVRAAPPVGARGPGAAWRCARRPRAGCARGCPRVRPGPARRPGGRHFGRRPRRRHKPPDCPRHRAAAPGTTRYAEAATPPASSVSSSSAACLAWRAGAGVPEMAAVVMAPSASRAIWVPVSADAPAAVASSRR